MRRDLADRFGVQLDVLALQRARPHAVVAQQPFGARRIARQDLLAEIRAVGELAVEIFSQQLTEDVVEETHRAVLRLPVGIDAHPRQHAVAHLPEDVETVPFAVRRDVRVQPAQAGLDRGVIVVGRSEPRRRPLEDEQFPDARRDLGDELHRARAGADHRDAPAVQIDGVIPARRMKARTCERIAAFDIGVERPVQLPDRADHRVGDDGLVAAVAISNLQCPASIRL